MWETRGRTEGCGGQTGQVMVDCLFVSKQNQTVHCQHSATKLDFQMIQSLTPDRINVCNVSSQQKGLEFDFWLNLPPKLIDSSGVLAFFLCFLLLTHSCTVSPVLSDIIIRFFFTGHLRNACLHQHPLPMCRCALAGSVVDASGVHTTL